MNLLLKSSVDENIAQPTSVYNQPSAEQWDRWKWGTHSSVRDWRAKLCNTRGGWVPGQAAGINFCTCLSQAMCARGVRGGLRRTARESRRFPKAHFSLCVCVPVCLSAANKEQEVQRQYNEKFRNYKNPRAKEMHWINVNKFPSREFRSTFKYIHLQQQS
jgi:hypothetical protein